MSFIKKWKTFLNEAEEADPGAETMPQGPGAKSSAIETDEYDYPYEDYEEASKETHFGKNPDSLQCIRDLRNPKIDVFPPDFYRCMEAAGYKKINAGSFRAVFENPENPDLVLKTVGPAVGQHEQKRSMIMNQEEAKASYQTASDLIPKVYDSARDYFWILSEKVKPITTWPHMQNYFPVWNNLISAGAFKKDDFQSWFYTLVDSRTTGRKDDKELAFNKLRKNSTNIEAQGKTDDELWELVEKLFNKSMFAKIRDLLSQFKLPAWDIRPHNVGYVIRNGRSQFVILDPGFGLGQETGTVADSPSKEWSDKGFDDLHAFSDIFKDDIAKTWHPEKKGLATTGIKENLNKNWQLFLENKGPQDFLYDITRSSDNITITLLGSETKEPVESKKEDTNAYISMEKRTEVPNWEVSWSSSPLESEGVGTIMYLMALELTEEGLSPDSYETSPDALRIWNKFMKKNEYGVEKELKDGHEGQDEEDPFNFVFFKPKSGILDQFSDKITQKEAKSEEKDEFDPEKEEKVEHFDPEQFNWEDLDDIDELYEQLTKDGDTNEVSKVIIADDGGKILILKRSDGRNDWDLPGGHLKKGENPAVGAHRETKEETNLDISGLKPLNTHKNTHFFKCGAPQGEISLQPDEHIDFKWINPKEIGQYSIRNSLKDAILSAIGLFNEQTEPYQRFSRGTFRKFITKLAKQGPNKYNVGGKMKKATAKHLKSGPPGG